MFSNWHTPTLFYSLRVYHWKEFLKANFNVKETFSQLKTYTFTILTGSFISYNGTANFAGKNKACWYAFLVLFCFDFFNGLQIVLS